MNEGSPPPFSDSPCCSSRPQSTCSGGMRTSTRLLGGTVDLQSALHSRTLAVDEMKLELKRADARFVELEVCCSTTFLSSADDCNVFEMPIQSYSQSLRKLQSLYFCARDALFPLIC